MNTSKSNDINHLGQTVGVSALSWQPAKMPGGITLVGTYCSVQPFLLSKHSAELYHAFSEDEQGADWTYLPYGPFANYNEFKQWLDTKSTEVILYAIIDNKDNKVKGTASFHDIDLTHGVIEVGGVKFARSVQRSPITTEAMYLMMKYVFEDCGFRRYQWRCNALNTASSTAAQRLGFSYEGTFRHAHVFKGYNRDTAWFSILDIEWPIMKQKFLRWLAAENFNKQGQQIQRLAEV